MNTGSVEGGTDWYSVLLGQNRAVLVASTMSCQKIYGLHGLDHQIIEYSKKKKVITDKRTDPQTDRHTDRISSCRLDPFCRRGRVKKKEFHCLLAPEPVLKTEAKIHSLLFDCAIFSLLRVYHCLFFWLDARKSCIFDLITSVVNS